MTPGANKGSAAAPALPALSLVGTAVQLEATAGPQRGGLTQRSHPPTPSWNPVGTS